jgi:CheY-like chemotaxis protein
VKLGQATILIVDDEPDLREIFSTWIGRDAGRVLTAANGVEALKILESEKIDVLLSDIRMPVMDGLTLVRTIYERRMNIPSIVFVSGYGDISPREMHGLGVEALLEKPLRRAELIRHLHETVTEREERWLQPCAEPMAQKVKLQLPSLLAARSGCLFHLGRGGCCFASNQPLFDQRTIDLSIDFVKDGLSLQAQGYVRWFDEHSGKAGMEFSTLGAGCREWVLKAIRVEPSRSFIPQCLGRPNIDEPGDGLNCRTIVPASIGYLH